LFQATERPAGRLLLGQLAITALAGSEHATIDEDFRHDKENF